MADFATLDGNDQNIPYTATGAAADALRLTNPDNVLSGQLRGSQYVGSANLQIDSTTNLITVKGINTLGNSVVKYGEIDLTHLGLAVNDGANDILFAGQDSTTTPASTYVKIAKTGFDAKTATNDQLVFNSAQDLFKVVASRTTNIPSQTITSNSSFGSVIIPHGLSFIPVLEASALVQYLVGYFPGTTTFVNAYVSLPYSPPVPPANVIMDTITCAVDATNVYFSYFYTTSGGTYTFPTIPIRYYLLQETAN